MTNPQLSIGMPVFNAERYLRAAIDSLLAQTYADFELIISDNASTDDTEAICREYAAADARVQYHRQPTNRGAAWNFNHVFELSCGEYFKWAAADDVCAPRFLEECVAVLANEPDVVCCHSRTEKIDVDGKVFEFLDDPTDGGVPKQHQRGTAWRPDASSSRLPRRFHDVLRSSGWSARSYAVIRCCAMDRSQLIQSFYGSEKVLMAELVMQGRFFDVPEVLFQQRIHAESSSNLGSAAEQQEFFLGTEKERSVGLSARFALLSGHLSAVFRHPMKLGERIGCLTALARYVLQVSKWPDVALRAYRRSGVGNAGNELKRAERIGCQSPSTPADVYCAAQVQSVNEL